MCRKLGRIRQNEHTLLIWLFEVLTVIYHSCKTKRTFPYFLFYQGPITYIDMMSSFSNFHTVSIFSSGALSLTAITLNRVVGTMMPKLANILELNRSIVYCILVVIWLISFGAAIPTFDYRRYDVSYMFWASLNTKWDLYNVLICFRPHISRITHYSFVQRVSFVILLKKIQK